jgi:hypothetical protein
VEYFELIENQSLLGVEDGDGDGDGDSKTNKSG